MLCCLLVFGSPKCKNHVRGFANSVRFVNVQKDFISELPLCANGCSGIFTCVDHLTKYTVLTACTLVAGELSAK